MNLRRHCRWPHKPGPTWTRVWHARGRVAEARMEPVPPATDFSLDFEDVRLVPAVGEP